MASDSSFDIVSKVNLQEVNNAYQQTLKEIEQRYDFRGVKAEILLEEAYFTITTSDDFKLKSIIDVLQSKLIKREVPIKNLDYQKAEPASGGGVRQKIGLKQGIDTEKAKQMVKNIKSLGLKIQAQIMGDQVRVSGKNKDDLQKVINFLKEKDYEIELQFVNYR